MSSSLVGVLPGQASVQVEREDHLMEQWQIDALQALLETETKEVEEGSRVYVSSKTYGDSRFHLLSKKYDSIQIEQTNVDEKYQNRVQLQNDELPAALKTMLIWYLDGIRQRNGLAATPDDDALGDLDEHPF
jgi:hypothetical protein